MAGIAVAGTATLRFLLFKSDRKNELTCLRRREWHKQASRKPPAPP